MDIKKNLKVLLVVPNFRWCEWNKNTLWHYIPYNFCLLASMVIDKCDVKILDANLLNLHLEKNCFNFLILDYGGKRLLGRLDKKYTPIKELINRNDITYIALKKERGYQSNLKALNVNMNYIYTGNYFDLIQINH